MEWGQSCLWYLLHCHSAVWYCLPAPANQPGMIVVYSPASNMRNQQETNVVYNNC